MHPQSWQRRLLLLLLNVMMSHFLSGILCFCVGCEKAVYYPIAFYSCSFLIFLFIVFTAVNFLNLFLFTLWLI